MENGSRSPAWIIEIRDYNGVKMANKCHCAKFGFCKMVVVCHLEFLEVGNFNWQSGLEA